MSIGRSGDRALGHRANPKIRRGFKSPSHSKSRLKPTEEPNHTIADFSPFDSTLGRSGLPTSPPGIEIPVS
ncbi:hypothetical protein QUB08_00230 [Microcoleus sp. BR0-C5]|uniref:hypothetical protein n=1 Tax=Microcoleus sp. BR0-C5 TaxID=2818713 RepID=UPI002FD1DB6D